MSGGGYRIDTHTARMTGAFWFIVRDAHGSRVRVGGIEYWDERDSAQEVADELNAGTLAVDA